MPAIYRRLLSSLAALALGGVSVCWGAKQAAHASLDTARDAASANMSTEEGVKFQAESTTALHSGGTAAMDQCLRKLATKPHRATVYVRLGTDAAVREVLTDPRSNASKCLERQARAARFPRPPRDDYWVGIRVILQP